MNYFRAFVLVNTCFFWPNWILLDSSISIRWMLCSLLVSQRTGYFRTTLPAVECIGHTRRGRTEKKLPLTIIFCFFLSMFKVSFSARFILKELMVHLYDDII